MPDSLVSRFKSTMQKLMPKIPSVQQNVKQQEDHDIGRGAIIERETSLTPMQEVKHQYDSNIREANNAGINHQQRIEIQNQYSKNVESVSKAQNKIDRLEETLSTHSTDPEIGRGAVVVLPRQQNIGKGKSSDRGLGI